VSSCEGVDTVLYCCILHAGHWSFDTATGELIGAYAGLDAQWEREGCEASWFSAGIQPPACSVLDLVCELDGG
jgi:hypothetical protein